MSRFWRAWPYRHVEVIDGRFDGHTGTILDVNMGRRVVVALDAGPGASGRVVKLEKRQLRPLPTPPKDARGARVRTGTRSG